MGDAGHERFFHTPYILPDQRMFHDGENDPLSAPTPYVPHARVGQLESVHSQGPFCLDNPHAKDCFAYCRHHNDSGHARRFLRRGPVGWSLPKILSGLAHAFSQCCGICGRRALAHGRSGPALLCLIDLMPKRGQCNCGPCRSIETVRSPC